jgi:polysaccharide chain length determinant protein (PEP-CTERM system associated)
VAQSSEIGEGTIDVRKLIALIERQGRGMLRYRWPAVVVAWTLAIVGWIAVYMLPDRYEASAQVFVDTESVLRPLLRGLSVEEDVLSDVTVVSRTVLTRPHLERVARETDLDLGAKTPREFDAVLDSLHRRIKIATSGANIYTISFEDGVRDKALDVVDKLLDAFVEDTLGSGQEDSQTAERALKKEIDDYERRLTESEEKLKEFKRQNVGLMPNEHGDYYAQLQVAMADLASVQQKLRVAAGKEASLARQLEGEEPLFGIMTPALGGGSAINGQISTLEQRRADLLVEFTEKHPEVVRIDQALKDLYSKREAERANGEAGVPMVSNPLDLNPVYQSIKIQRSKVEVELASLRAELGDKQATVDRLQKLVDVIPQVEAELNRLNRDYDVIKARYSEMLQRWEALQTGKRVKTGTEQVQFRIINPPFAALDPAGPPRDFFILAVSVFSVGTGLAIAFLLNLMFPVYHNTHDLAQYGRPILGTIGLRESPDGVRKRRAANLALAAASAAFLICMGAAMFLSGVGSRFLRDLV